MKNCARRRGAGRTSPCAPPCAPPGTATAAAAGPAVAVAGVGVRTRGAIDSIASYAALSWCRCRRSSACCFSARARCGRGSCTRIGTGTGAGAGAGGGARDARPAGAGSISGGMGGSDTVSSMLTARAGPALAGGGIRELVPDGRRCVLSDAARARVRTSFICAARGWNS